MRNTSLQLIQQSKAKTVKDPTGASSEASSVVAIRVGNWQFSQLRVPLDQWRLGRNLSDKGPTQQVKAVVINLDRGTYLLAHSWCAWIFLAT